MQREPRVSDMRRAVAPIFGLADENLRVRVDGVYRQPELATILPGRRRGGGDREGLRATAGATAIVITTAMLNLPREASGRGVARLWLAKYSGPGARCAITGAANFGEALTRLIGQQALRDLLDSIDLMGEFELVSLHWRDSTPASRFHPHTPREWAKVQRRARALDDSAVHITRLPGPTLNKIAGLLEPGGTA